MCVHTILPLTDVSAPLFRVRWVSEGGIELGLNAQECKRTTTVLHVHGHQWEVDEALVYM